ncbi:MAG: NAD(P)-dependent dehydrogenase (short-subunit alcohol dehydrogenase family) [Candidatus Krumholzibacteriia bacterium]
MQKRTFFALMLVIGTCFGSQMASGQEDSSPWSGQTVVITGANRGLGLELARQLHAAGAQVIGTARKPEAAEELRKIGVRVEQLDVADAASVAALAERLGDMKIDVLMNNAGIMPQRVQPSGVDLELMERVLAVNTTGPLRVSLALMPAMRRGEGKMIMNMSSGLGSITNNTNGAFADYRASKAALNMISRSQAAELAPEGFIVVSMSPGWVRTDMGGDQANLSPAESVEGILRTLAGLEASQSGGYFNHDGSELPW